MNTNTLARRPNGGGRDRGTPQGVFLYAGYIGNGGDLFSGKVQATRSLLGLRSDDEVGGISGALKLLYRSHLRRRHTSSSDVKHRESKGITSQRALRAVQRFSFLRSRHYAQRNHVEETKPGFVPGPVYRNLRDQATELLRQHGYKANGQLTPQRERKERSDRRKERRRAHG